MSATAIDMLERVQTQAARITTGAIARSSLASLQEETGWETLKDRRARAKLHIFYRMITKEAPQKATIPNRSPPDNGRR